MKRHTVQAMFVLCAAVLFGTAQVASAAGFKKLSKVGDPVMTECNPTNSAWNHRCKVNSLPGEPGYMLIASRAAPLIYNDIDIDIDIGSLHARELCHQVLAGRRGSADSNQHPGAGLRVQDGALAV